MSEFSKEPCDIGDLMTVAEYLSCVECGGFIDYDGYGLLATSEGHVKGNPWDGCIKPSQKGKDIPPGITHIVWYNR